MLTSRGTTSGSLVGGLVEQVRELADSRELELDISLNGKPVEVSAPVAEALILSISDALEAARLTQDLHHIALVVDYRSDGLYAKLEHDGTFDSGSRSQAEEMVIAIYNRLGILGGSVAFSLGRGFGLRLEISVPYSKASMLAYPLGESVQIRPSLPVSAPSRSVAPPVERLTPQEDACLALLAAGFSNKEIAARLHISAGTVKFHLAQIYQKLGVRGRGRGAAVARARELGLIFD